MIELMSDDRCYYVYILFDWFGIPRWIGKGRGRRWIQHERSTDLRNQLKNEFIEQTWIVLGEIPKIKVREELTRNRSIGYRNCANKSNWTT